MMISYVRPVERASNTSPPVALGSRMLLMININVCYSSSN